MRIVQTLWTGRQSLLTNAFGWLHPEYHLMAWALSVYCLKEREKCKHLALYTDLQGASCLIDSLALPFDEVVTDYDALTCRPEQWAYAKVRTYERQEEPFLHVDADVFVSSRFPEQIRKAELVAQNEEYASDYYNAMIKEMLAYPELRLPTVLDNGLHSDDIKSFNMGIFGGTDLNFIHQYCQTFFKFYETNHPDARVRNCNVISEQIFFGILAYAENKVVSCLLPGRHKDNGYTRKDFCDLRKFDNTPFFHLLGGHKRRKEVCRWLELMLIRFCPDTYNRIARLFPERHARLNTSAPSTPSWTTLLEAEQYVAASLHHTEPQTLPKELLLTAYPGLTEVGESSGKTRFRMPSVGIFPEKEIEVGDLGYNILNILSFPMSLESLFTELSPLFEGSLAKNALAQEELIRQEIVFLL